MPSNSNFSASIFIRISPVLKSEIANRKLTRSGILPAPASRWQGSKANAASKDLNKFRLGCFDSELDAAKAYDAAKMYHKEFACLNFS